jgi:hypothetical protein
VEYSIIAAAIAAVIVVIVTAVGIKTGNLFESLKWPRFTIKKNKKPRCALWLKQIECFWTKKLSSTR